MYEAKCIQDKVTKGGWKRVAVRGKGISGSLYFKTDTDPGDVKVSYHEADDPGFDEVVRQIQMERAHWS